MLLQTNSYIVPPEKRPEHMRLMRRFRQTLARLGCEEFDIYEQLGPNWSPKGPGRFVQIMRFRDRRHFQSVQAAERNDTPAQQLIQEFCELVDFAGQQERGEYFVNFYSGALPETLAVGGAHDAAEIAGDDVAAQETVDAPGAFEHPASDKPGAQTPQGPPPIRSILHAPPAPHDQLTLEDDDSPNA